MKKGYILAIALLAGGLAVGCDALFDTPEKAAREWTEAFLLGDIDKLKGRVCAKLGENVPKRIELMLKNLQSVVKKVDLSGVNFEATVNGDTATVKVSGKAKAEVSFFGQTETREFSLDEDYTSLELIKEDGTWKMCVS